MQCAFVPIRFSLPSRGCFDIRPRGRSVTSFKRDPKKTLTKCQAVETLSKQKTTISLTDLKLDPGFSTDFGSDKSEHAVDSFDTAQVSEPSTNSMQTLNFVNLWQTLSSKVVIPDRVRGLILLNLMTLIMSTNFVVVKDAEVLMDPFSFSAARFITASLPFLPLLSRMKIDEATFQAGAEIGLWSTLGYLTQGIGLLSTDASRVSFLSALTVILVPFIVGLSGRGVSKLAWASAVAAMFGVGLLSGTGMGGSLSCGDWMSLISAGFFAMQIVRTEHFSRILPAKSRLSVLGVGMLTVAVGSSLLACGFHPDYVLSSIQQLDSLSPQSLISWASLLPGKALLFTGFISTDIALLLELTALQEVDSTDAAIVYTMEPVLGALWAYILLGERWGPNGWIGAALILASSFVTQMHGSNDKDPDQ